MKSAKDASNKETSADLTYASDEDSLSPSFHNPRTLDFRSVDIQYMDSHPLSMSLHEESLFVASAVAMEASQSLHFLKNQSISGSTNHGLVHKYQIQLLLACTGGSVVSFFSNLENSSDINIDNDDILNERVSMREVLSAVIPETNWTAGHLAAFCGHINTLKALIAQISACREPLRFPFMRSMSKVSRGDSLEELDEDEYLIDQLDTADDGLDNSPLVTPAGTPDRSVSTTDARKSSLETESNWKIEIQQSEVSNNVYDTSHSNRPVHKRTDDVRNGHVSKFFLIRSRCGFTPLHIAAIRGRCDVLDLLMKTSNSALFTPGRTMESRTSSLQHHMLRSRFLNDKDGMLQAEDIRGNTLLHHLAMAKELSFSAASLEPLKVVQSASFIVPNSPKHRRRSAIMHHLLNHLSRAFSHISETSNENSQASHTHPYPIEEKSVQGELEKSCVFLGERNRVTDDLSIGATSNSPMESNSEGNCSSAHSGLSLGLESSRNGNDVNNAPWLRIVCIKNPKRKAAQRALRIISAIGLVCNYGVSGHRLNASGQRCGLSDIMALRSIEKKRLKKIIEEASDIESADPSLHWLSSSSDSGVENQNKFSVTNLQIPPNPPQDNVLTDVRDSISHCACGTAQKGRRQGDKINESVFPVFNSTSNGYVGESNESQIKKTDSVYEAENASQDDDRDSSVRSLYSNNSSISDVTDFSWTPRAGKGLKLVRIGTKALHIKGKHSIIDRLALLMGWKSLYLRDQLGLSTLLKFQKIIRLTARELSAPIWSGYVRIHSPSLLSDHVEAEWPIETKSDGHWLENQKMLVVTCDRLAFLSASSWELIDVFGVGALQEIAVCSSCDALLFLRLNKRQDMLLETSPLFRRQLMHHIQWAAACRAGRIQLPEPKQILVDRLARQYSLSRRPSSSESTTDFIEEDCTSLFSTIEEADGIKVGVNAAAVDDCLELQEEGLDADKFEFLIPARCFNDRHFHLEDSSGHPEFTFGLLLSDVFLLQPYPSSLSVGTMPFHFGYVRVRIPPEGLPPAGASPSDGAQLQAMFTKKVSKFGSGVETAAAALACGSFGPDWRECFAVVDYNGVLRFHNSPTEVTSFWEKSLKRIVLFLNIYALWCFS
eukprot:GHVL01018919.1.p1 GENE.GHVL01018919.1~~GHVL01018919.1.p1  ORF type:complete len:1115 (-),score=157.99 GHVL01018919.1:567-3911(-)